MALDTCWFPSVGKCNLSGICVCSLTCVSCVREDNNDVSNHERRRFQSRAKTFPITSEDNNDVSNYSTAKLKSRDVSRSQTRRYVSRLDRSKAHVKRGIYKSNYRGLEYLRNLSCLPHL